MKKASFALIVIMSFLLFTLVGCTPIGKARWATEFSATGLAGCIDSDGKAIDPYNQNYVTYNNQKYYDQCIVGGSGIMEEATCHRDTFSYQQYSCGNEGMICYNGACVRPGECAIPLDCGLDEPIGMPYCQRNNIMLDLRIFECTPQGNQAFIVPGSVCTNKIINLQLYTCPNGTECVDGTCTDHDTLYQYCYDSDNTKENLDLFNDTSFSIPSTTLRIQPPQEGAPTVMYFNDFCDVNNPVIVEEKYCKNNQVETHIVECSNLEPRGAFQNCQLYRNLQTNRYVAWPTNIGACS
ncbi:hypothetical protein KY335_05120 [Candidatus Woesearchaeota archaeon]|nr:hypothetical protein [Candidatus Woesearchaeota archaeon]MBW3014591.1 hypothetical protein [Candidatus Woesearchaeota archaeon]